MTTRRSQPGPEEHGAADIGWSLGVLLRALHQTVSDVIGDLPHGPRGYYVLAAVAHADKPSQLALAEHLGIDRTVMTYLIDDLVEAGLVERQPNPSDRRQRRILTTKRGDRTLTNLDRRVREAEDHILGTLAPAERVIFRSLLGRVACAVRDTGPMAEACDLANETIAGRPARRSSRGLS